MNGATRRSKAAAGVVRLSAGSDLTIYSAARLKKSLVDALNQPGPLELDLSEVEDMDTAGVQLLVALKREGQRRNREIRLVSHSPTVVAVLDLFSLSGPFGDPVVISAPERELK